MVEFNVSEEIKYVTPFTMYMEYILLNYNNFLGNHLKKENITTREFLYLFNIFYNKNISQKELAELMYVSEANIAKIVKKLVEKGYVSRRKDDDNKSRNLLTLTKEGISIVLQLVKITIEWETKVSGNYDSFFYFLNIFFIFQKIYNFKEIWGINKKIIKIIC